MTRGSWLRGKVRQYPYFVSRETKQTWRNTKILTFGPIIAPATLKAAPLQLNGIFMKWKIQRAIAIQTARIHSAFIPVTGMNCSYGKISMSPLTEISGTDRSPFIWTHRKFYKEFWASSHKPPWEVWLGYLWVHMRNFSPVSEIRKGQRSWGWVLEQTSRNKPRQNAKIITFAPNIALAAL